jgi:TRAP-type C4-dicarboxylate transport system permease large subunit
VTLLYRASIPYLLLLLVVLVVITYVPWLSLFLVGL